MTEHPFSGRAKRDHAPEVQRNEVTEHQVHGQVKGDRPPRHNRVKRGSAQLATE